MRSITVIIFCLINVECVEYFIDNSVTFLTENGSFDYPFRSLDDALKYYNPYSNDSDPSFHVIILSNTFNYSINELYVVQKPLQISFLNEQNKAGIIFSSKNFHIQENGESIILLRKPI